MSSMLEQAVIDAKMLREAAVKNAEETLIEKYSDDIKDAVEKLLEQDEEELEKEGGDPEVDVPLAACPDDDEEEAVEVTLTTGELAKADSMEEMIDFDLQEMKAQLEELEEDEIGTPEPHEEVAEEIAEEVEDSGSDLEEDFEIDLSEEDLEELLEKVIVDMESVPPSWGGRPAKEADFEVEKDLARLAQEGDLDEDEDKLKKEKKELEEKMNKLQEAVKAYQEREEQYKDVVSSLKEKFDEIALSNTRLLYTNKILSSTSLNERQKQKVVDAISNISSAEEAKVIFETLESAVGSMSSRRGPKSLSEAVEKRTSSLLAGRRKDRQSDMPDPVRNRMQRLAGINNK